MTLDYTKMFLIVTEEAVVKGHFALICTAPLGRFFAARKEIRGSGSDAENSPRHRARPPVRHNRTGITPEQFSELLRGGLFYRIKAS